MLNWMYMLGCFVRIFLIKLYVLRTSYWWDIRAIYRQYFEILDVNIVNRWFWYPTSNWFLKHTRLIRKYSYTAAQHIYSVWPGNRLLVDSSRYMHAFIYNCNNNIYNISINTYNRYCTISIGKSFIDSDSFNWIYS